MITIMCIEYNENCAKSKITFFVLLWNVFKTRQTITDTTQLMWFADNETASKRVKQKIALSTSGSSSFL